MRAFEGAFERERFFCGNRFEREIRQVILRFLRFQAFCLHLAVDGDVRILIEACIGFESRFGLGSAFADRENSALPANGERKRGMTVQKTKSQDPNG